MRTFAVVSLLLVSAAASLWYVGHAIRERELGMGKYFGSRVEFRWPEQPLRFLFGLSCYGLLAALMTWGAVAGMAQVDPPLWALWPGMLGPIATMVLSSRDDGEPASKEVLEAFVAHLLAGERNEAQTLVGERTAKGSTRRLLEAALRGLPEAEPATDYRASAVPRGTAVLRALEHAHEDAARRRGRLRLLPTTAALGACLVILVRPPRSELGAVWAVLALELALAGVAVLSERRRSRRQGEVLSFLRARMRSG